MMTEDAPRRPGRPPKLSGEPQFISAADAGVKTFEDDMDAAMLADDGDSDATEAARSEADPPTPEGGAGAGGADTQDDPGASSASRMAEDSPADPLADAPRDGRRVILKDANGAEVVAAYRFTRRYDPNRGRFVGISYWSDPLRAHVPLVGDFIDWRAY